MRTHKVYLDPQLESKLVNWACYIISIHLNEVGYPNKSILYQIFEQGGKAPERVFGSSSPFYNERAEIVNTLINKMKANFPDYAEVIYLCYLTNWTRRKIASHLNVTPRTVYLRLSAAKDWLNERM